MSADGRGARAATWAPLAVAAALFAVLLQRSWMRWHDILIDYARELYVPWRMTEGEVLYRDLAWFNGPLSAHGNAAAFALFGVGYRTLAWVNLVLLVLFAALLWRVLARLGSALSAGVSIAFLVPVSFLACHVTIANYNFVTPYSHELTHGLILGVAAFAVALRTEVGARGRALAVGALLGLVFLTKAEVAVAAAAGTALALANVLASARAGRREWTATALLVLSGFTGPVAAAWLLLSTAMPPGDALVGVLGSWRGILGTATSELEFYEFGMGLDRPGHNLLLMAASAGIVAATLLPALLCERLVRVGARGRWAVALLLVAAPAAVWLPLELHPGNLARPLPAFLLAALAVLAVRWRRADDPARRRAIGERAAWCALSLVLLAKEILFTRFQHYGFVLTVPAATCVVGALVDDLPGALRARGAWGGYARAGALGLLAVVGVRSWAKAEPVWQVKSHWVGEGRDRFRADDRERFVRAALSFVDENFGPDSELLVLPEGVMLNYLSRRRSPTPYINFMPPELILFGEETILDALRANAPPCIVVIHKDTSEYGFPYFGRDYGRAIWSWIVSSYVPVHQLGPPPLQPGTNFGLLVLARADLVSAPEQGR